MPAARFDMNALELITPPSLFLEIGQSSLKMLAGEAGFEVPLERQPNGKLTVPCREKMSATLREIVQKRNWLGRPRAICAIGARGVSLRRVTLPPTTKENFHQFLTLQIEKEFPLSPDELAWGYYSLNPESEPRNGSISSQELVVAAVKKEGVEEYSELLSSCGVNPIFTLGVLASRALCPRTTGAHAILDIGRHHSELLAFEDGVPTAVRSLSWGGEDITRAVEQALQISRDEAEQLKTRLEEEAVSNPERAAQARAAVQAAVGSLAVMLKSSWKGPVLYLTGKSARLAEMAPCLSESLGIPCERLNVAEGEGQSAAILALRQFSESNGHGPQLVLQVKGAKRNVERIEQSALTKWAALAALLVICSFFLRYAEALVRMPGLSKRMAEVKALKAKLPQIDHELSFLQYLETNQPAYLNTLTAIAEAGRGTRIDSLTMNRRGDLTLRGSMPSSQQATDFRTALIKSGLFSSVVIDEQTPSQDRKVTVRITGKWKTAKDPKADTVVKSEVTNAPASKAPAPAPVGASTNSPGPVRNLESKGESPNVKASGG